jgi:hypothetical protein
MIIVMMIASIDVTRAVIAREYPPGFPSLSLRTVDTAHWMKFIQAKAAANVKPRVEKLVV